MLQQENQGGRHQLPAPSAGAAAMLAEGRPPLGRAVADAEPAAAGGGKPSAVDAAVASGAALDGRCESGGRRHAMAAVVDEAVAAIALSASPEARVELAVPVLGAFLVV